MKQYIINLMMVVFLISSFSALFYQVYQDMGKCPSRCIAIALSK